MSYFDFKIKNILIIVMLKNAIITWIWIRKIILKKF